MQFNNQFIRMATHILVSIQYWYDGKFCQLSFFFVFYHNIFQFLFILPLKFLSRTFLHNILHFFVYLFFNFCITHFGWIAEVAVVIRHWTSLLRKVLGTGMPLKKRPKRVLNMPRLHYFDMCHASIKMFQQVKR